MIKVINGFLGVFVLVVTIGCGSSGDSVTGNSADRAAYANTSESLEPCQKARDETIEEPLKVYVDALKILADQGEPCAQYGLGTLYAMGYDSIVSDRVLAKHYLELAADQDHEEAETELLTLVTE